MVEITPEIRKRALQAKSMKEFWRILKHKKGERVTVADIGLDLLPHWQKLADIENGYSSKDPIHWENRKFFKHCNRELDRLYGKDKD